MLDPESPATTTTRKSSCVNARGIPTAAYQVLHLLTEVGYPPLGYPPSRSDGGYPRWGTTHWGTPPSRSDPGGTRGGVLPIGVPPCWGTPCQGIPPLGYPPIGVPPRLDLAWVPPPGWTWLGYPPPPRCEQTENITFPHPSDAVGNKYAQQSFRG